MQTGSLAKLSLFKLAWVLPITITSVCRIASLLLGLIWSNIEHLEHCVLFLMAFSLSFDALLVKDN